LIWFDEKKKKDGKPKISGLLKKKNTLNAPCRKFQKINFKEKFPRFEYRKNFYRKTCVSLKSHRKFGQITFQTVCFGSENFALKFLL